MNSSSLHSPIPCSKSKRAKPDSESIAATPKSKTSSNPTIVAQTPTKPSPLPPHLWSRRVAVSLKEVRQVASRDLGTNQTKSARRQIMSWHEDPTTTGKLHKPGKKQFLCVIFFTWWLCVTLAVCYICYVTLGECGSVRKR